MPFPFSVKPTLVGELVRLRPIRSDDADAIDAIIRSDPEVARQTGSIHRTGEPASDLSIERMREIYGEWAVADDRLVFAIVDRASGAVVGESVLNEWDEANAACGFRTLIGDAGRGRGLGTESTRLTIAYGFAAGIHRISLEVHDVNPRARHVCEKVGFVHEGTGREDLRFDDEWIDVHYMSMLDSDRRPLDWPSIRVAAD